MDRERLFRVIRTVRRRWRLKVALRGALVVALGGFLAVATAAYALERLDAGTTVLWSLRLLVIAVVVLLAARYLVLPLARRVPDERVALYLEERAPSLDGAVLSAVEFGTGEAAVDGPDPPGGRPAGHSSALVRGLVESALERCRSVEFGKRVERRELRRVSVSLAVLATAFLAASTLTPSFLQRGLPVLITPWADPAPESHGIAVRPGDGEVARGADVMVRAALRGFDSDRVELAVRPEAGTWERTAMTIEEETGEHVHMILEVDAPTDYYVEASGIRSPLYRLAVVDVPHVDRLDLTVNHPPYTGREPEKIEDGGDVIAVPGTEVGLRVVPTVEVTGGRVRVAEDRSDSDGEDRSSPDPAAPTAAGEGRDDADVPRRTVPLDLRADGTLAGRFTVRSDGRYRIDLRTQEGEMVEASSEYLIDLVEDRPPTVRFEAPGADLDATPIEEVFTEVRATDDYGIDRIDLVYSVNGGKERSERLYRAGVPSSGRATSATPQAPRELTAGHTFFLEEEELEPGDFVSYYARAADVDAVSGPGESASDIHFITIRPFDRELRQADAAPSGGGSGLNGAFAERQQQIVSATFKLRRDRRRMSEERFRDDLATVAMLQGRLRQQVESFVSRAMESRLLAAGIDAATIARHLGDAAEEMVPAEEALGNGDPAAALPPEQRALQQLQRAEAVVRSFQVARSSDPGGRGSSRGISEELADLFALEADKLGNQYESVQRGRRRQLDEDVDEALRRLEELARRQQQQNERLRRQDGRTSADGGRAGVQRRLAEETERLARRLERLSRRRSRPRLMDTARRLRRALESMRRAAGRGGEERLGEGLSAAEALRDARRLLEGERSGRLQRDLRQVRQEVDCLRRQQESVSERVARQRRSSSPEELSEILERKDAMADRVQEMQTRIDRMAQESREDQPTTSRSLDETADWLRDSKLADKLRYSKGVVQERSGSYARRFEEQIGADLEELGRRVRRAASTLADSPDDRLADSLDRTRELVDRLESLERRLQAQGDGAPRSETGAPGSDAPDGSPPSTGGAPDGAGGRYGPGTPVDPRQLQGEFERRVDEAEALRRELSDLDVQVTDLDAVLQRMREFERHGFGGGTPRGVERLREQVIDELKLFEFWLRRTVAREDGERPVLRRSGTVPERFRDLVDEYFRTLSEESPPPEGRR